MSEEIAILYRGLDFLGIVLFMLGTLVTLVHYGVSAWPALRNFEFAIVSI